MNNLFNLFHGSEDNDFLAASVELPLTFRIHNGKEHNTRTIKSEYILRTGSHHGFGMNALMAYRLYQELSVAGDTSEKIKELQNCNLEVLTANPHNIGAIIQCMPKNCDATRIIEFAYPGSVYGQFEKSDFAYFAKSNDKPLKDKPTASLLLIADIYSVLQRCNRYKADDKLQKKIDAVYYSAVTTN